MEFPTGREGGLGWAEDAPSFNTSCGYQIYNLELLGLMPLAWFWLYLHLMCIFLYLFYPKFWGKKWLAMPLKALKNTIYYFYLYYMVKSRGTLSSISSSAPPPHHPRPNLKQTAASEQWPLSDALHAQQDLQGKCSIWKPPYCSIIREQR